mgnify:CR=1 FL=1
MRLQEYMEKISLQKKSFFNSIGLDINNLPPELKLKASHMQSSLPRGDIEFLNTNSLTKIEQKHFRLKNLVGTNNLAYGGKTWLEIFVNNDKSDECDVCYDEINEEDKKLNTIPCGHLFCTHCWFNYLKTSIIEAKVDNIRCMDHECNEIITDEFILKHISENKELEIGRASCRERV